MQQLTASIHRVAGSSLLLTQFPANVHPGRQQLMTQVLGPPSPMGETQEEFPAAAVALDQLGNEPGMEDLSWPFE